MKQRQVLCGVGVLVGVLVLSGCTADLAEPEFVGSYVGDDATTVVALGEDRTFTAVGIPDEVLAIADAGARDGAGDRARAGDDPAAVADDGTVDTAVSAAVEAAREAAEIEGTWRYVASSADHVVLTVTDADGVPSDLGELPLYVADADDLFFLPDPLGREKVMVSRSS